jgi:WD40 repeat protein
MWVGFLPGGGLVVHGEDPVGLRVFDPATGEHRRDLPPRAIVTTAAVASGTGLVVYGGNWCDESDVATVWDPATGTDLHLPGGPPAGRTTFVVCCAVSADGRAVAVADRPRGARGHRIRVWEVPAGGPAGEVWCPATVHALAFSPDGATLAAGCGDGGGPGEVRIWDVPRPPAGSR